MRCTKAYDGDYFDDDSIKLVAFTDESKGDADSIHGESIGLLDLSGVEFTDESKADANSIHGEFIGLLKLSEAGAKAMQTAIGAMKKDGSLNDALLSRVLERMKADGLEIAIHYISGPWLDVDNAFDLARARNIL